MIDIPSLGVAYLDNALTHIAAVEESSIEIESLMEVLDTAKQMVQPTPLKRALTATSANAAEHLQRERDVMRARLEVYEVKNW